MTEMPSTETAVSATPIDGGCFCGALRYRIERVDNVANCHCSMCRRTSGAPFVTWLVVPRDRFNYTLGVPAHLKSSARGDRYFCAQCGTPVACVVASQPGYIDITLGSLDHPQAFAPAVDVHRRSRLPWVEIKSQPRGD